MKIKNITKHNYAHSKLDEAYRLQMIILKPNEVKDIPDDVAESWLKSGGVVKYVEPKDLEKIEDENKKLKEQLKELKTKEVQEEKPKKKNNKKAKKG